MKKVTTFLRKYYGIAKYGAFPLLLLAFSLIKINKGIDLADTAYSLGNYETFAGSDSIWLRLTFLSNVIGHFFNILPFGHTMIGMKIYCSLTVGITALIGYRFFMTKIPAWLAFLAELAAIGLCWAPNVILYNYLTYILFLAGAVLLFRGLAGEHNICLFAAGIVLGLNLFVRFPNNVLEVLLIFALWYYGIIKKKSFEDIGKKTLICIGGYAVSFIALYIIVECYFGKGALSSMVAGALGISGSASDYTFGSMIAAIFDAYMHGLRWALYIIICAAIGIPFFVLYRGRFEKVRKLIYCICIPMLFFVLYKWGMYNFRYYQKESALQWGVLFLLISIGSDIWMLVSDRINHDWKLIAMISLVMILITPLGSNNHVWPALNFLFFISPVTFWTIYRFFRWGREYLDVTRMVPLFSIKAMLLAVVMMFFIQSVGLGAFYVFNDGEDGTKLSQNVPDCEKYAPRLKGIKTGQGNAGNLGQLAAFIGDDLASLAKKNGMDRSELKYVFYGNIPGISYYLDLPSGISTTWTDLNSYPVETFVKEMEDIKKASDNGVDVTKLPVIIKSKTIADRPDNSIKLNEIDKLINSYGYENVFFNDGYVVYTCLK